MNFLVQIDKYTTCMTWWFPTFNAGDLLGVLWNNDIWIVKNCLISPKFFQIINNINLLPLDSFVIKTNIFEGNYIMIPIIEVGQIETDRIKNKSLW